MATNPPNKPTQMALPGVDVRKRADILGDRVRQNMVESTERLKNLFAAADMLEQRTLNVETFRINFLPYFCGELPFEADVMTAWAHVAGTLLNPVGLTDAEGVVQVVVPAIVDTSIIRSVGRTKDGNGRGAPLASADTIIAQVQQRASFNPAMATNRMVQQLGERFLFVADGPSAKLKNDWAKLFAYFGKSASPQLGGVAADPKAISVDDDFDCGFD